MSDLVNVDNKAESEAIAGKISELSREIDDNFTKASNLFLNGDPSEWAGKDADSYKQKLEELKVKVTSSIDEFNKLSNYISNKSDEIDALDKINESKAANELTV